MGKWPAPVQAGKGKSGESRRKEEEDGISREGVQDEASDKRVFLGEGWAGQGEGCVCVIWRRRAKAKKGNVKEEEE